VLVGAIVMLEIVNGIGVAKAGVAKETAVARLSRTCLNFMGRLQG
jgi:hypothetical protein